MSIDTRKERLARRIADLYATDQQFAAARPSQTVTTNAIEQPGLRLAEMDRATGAEEVEETDGRRRQMSLVNPSVPVRLRDLRCRR